jgi:hypothetical protein
VQTDFVKFRITPDLKDKLREVAEGRDTSISAIVRHAAVALAEGRTLKPANLADFVAMRSAANELTAAVGATATTTDPDGVGERIRALAAELHRLAARQLTGPR